MRSDEKFLQLLRENTCLWDPNHQNYRNPAVREKTWKYMADQMGSNVLRCRNKYKEFRERYKKILSRKDRTGPDFMWVRQLDFWRKSFKNLPKLPTLTQSGAQGNSTPIPMNPTQRGRSLSLQDPLFLDPDQLSNSSVKIEEFPSDLATLRIVEPREPLTNGQNDTTTRNEDFEIISSRSLHPSKVSMREMEEYRLPQLTQLNQPSRETSGFVLALDEKLKLLPPRVRNRLERDIFVMVSDEVAKML